ncbi:hypothetical protein AB0I22_12295 [Streptomyces sp. NPDC050610]|uniref:hypothetical protein n=1 Tax=Streptomyces sp. NPDC050610 TaxID=3157097 RepID=UPI0034231954
MDFAALKALKPSEYEDAEAKSFSIGADGSVSYPAAGDEVDGKTPKGGSANGSTDETARAVARQAANFAPNPDFRLAQECANRIAEALKEATVVDHKWVPQLRKLMADERRRQRQPRSAWRALRRPRRRLDHSYRQVVRSERHGVGLKRSQWVLG